MLESVDQQYVKIGRIAQAHGVDGTVLMIPENYTPTLFDDIDLVRMQNARGDLIPARPESVRVQEKKNRLSFFVKFDHITDRNQADRLKGFPVYVAKDKVQQLAGESAEPNYISFEIHNENNEHVGTVSDIIPNPAHLILKVQAKKQEILVPLVDEYVNDINKENAIIYCQNLDQLIDLE